MHQAPHTLGRKGWVAILAGRAQAYLAKTSRSGDKYVQYPLQKNDGY
jgi:hypothetical protein